MTNQNPLLAPGWEKALTEVESLEGYIDGTEWVSALGHRGEKVPLLAETIRALHRRRAALEQQIAALMEVLTIHDEIRKNVPAIIGDRFYTERCEIQAKRVALADKLRTAILASLPNAAAERDARLKAEGAVEALDMLGIPRTPRIEVRP